MKKLFSCEFNMDTVCVELRLSNGSMISIDTIAVENEVADNMYERSELDYLIQCTAGIKKFGAKVYKISRDRNDRLTRLSVTDGALSVRDEIKYGDFTEKSIR